MKNFIVLIFVFFSMSLFAQEKKTETKEERKQRYIEEVNPFNEFGYRPKIATLSKGKYREAFPDSIVQIGSFTYNRVSKKIIGIQVIDESNLSESDLKPELVSRWMTPDPLSEEFPDKSPYNFVNNNPLRFVDPTGLAPEDLIITGKTDEFISTVNEQLGGDFASVDENGLVSLNITEDQYNNLSDGQKALYDTINEPVSAEGDTTIQVVSNSIDIRFGGAESGQIDIADINNIGDGTEAFTQASVLGHEVKEQFELQVGTDGVPVDKYEAHNRGEAVEANITGWTRTGTGRGQLKQEIIPSSAKRGLSGTGLRSPYRKALSGKGTFTYQKGDQTRTATVTYKYGNVVRVKEN